VALNTTTTTSFSDPQISEKLPKDHQGYGSAATLTCNRENSAIIKNTIILNIIQHIFNLRETEVVMCMITADCMVVVVVFNATFNNISAMKVKI
jgi:hypothetical protein